MRPVVAANWKMNHGPAAAKAFGRDLASLGIPPGVETVIFPPAPSLAALGESLPEGVALGAQNLMWEEAGAFTGEIAPGMAAEAGATWALAGHSERRALFGEGDEMVARRLAAIAAAGMVGVLCVGETAAERAAGQTEAVLARQLAPARETLAAPGRLLLAYEPVWAIGSGSPAGPDEAAAGAQACRRLAGAGLRVLYGGSVNPGNLGSYLGTGEVDGVLVGGASLTAAGLSALLAAAA